MDIESPTGEHLGDVDGFVVDASSGRPYYIVVDAGGWFKSKEYLLPVGHAALDADRQVFVTSLGREHVDRFPGFDKDEFEKLSEADIRRFNDETCIAIAGETIIFPTAEPLSRRLGTERLSLPRLVACRADGSRVKGRARRRCPGRSRPADAGGPDSSGRENRSPDQGIRASRAGKSRAARGGRAANPC